jgi:CheY-like chemotaxis protein
VCPTTVLWIDDDRLLLGACVPVLGRQGYRVLVAHDGAMGSATAKRERHDAILLDVVMPTTNGLEVCRHLRADPALQDTPIILLTALEDAHGVPEGTRPGRTRRCASPPAPSLSSRSWTRWWAGCTGRGGCKSGRMRRARAPARATPDHERRPLQRDSPAVRAFRETRGPEHGPDRQPDPCPSQRRQVGTVSSWGAWSVPRRGRTRPRQPGLGVRRPRALARPTAPSSGLTRRIPFARVAEAADPALGRHRRLWSPDTPSKDSVMAERRERRQAVRVALSGTQIVWTHEGLGAHLLDLSLQGARVAHFGILRPGALCFAQLATAASPGSSPCGSCGA